MTNKDSDAAWQPSLRKGFAFPINDTTLAAVPLRRRLKTLEVRTESLRLSARSAAKPQRHDPIGMFVALTLSGLPECSIVLREAFREVTVDASTQG